MNHAIRITALFLLICFGPSAFAQAKGKSCTIQVANGVINGAAAGATALGAIGGAIGGGAGLATGGPAGAVGGATIGGLAGGAAGAIGGGVIGGMGAHESCNGGGGNGTLKTLDRKPEMRRLND